MNDIVKTEERRRTITPPSRVLETEGKMVVRLEMPGVSQSDLEIRIEGQELTVVGKRQDEAVHGAWLIRERRRGDFHKTYSVDGSIDLEKIDAALSAGILTLTLPMKDAAKPRRIEIKAS
jgi:HSP20 family protein